MVSSSILSQEVEAYMYPLQEELPAAVHEWLETAVPWGTWDYSLSNAVPPLNAVRQRPLRTRSTPHLVKPVTVTKLLSRSQSAAVSP